MHFRKRALSSLKEAVLGVFGEGTVMCDGEERGWQRRRDLVFSSCTTPVQPHSGLWVTSPHPLPPIL
jgi:hypothetical protein